MTGSGKEEHQTPIPQTPITEERIRHVSALPVIPSQASRGGGMLPWPGHPLHQSSGEARTPLPAGIAARSGRGHQNEKESSKHELKERIEEHLREIYDPEIPVNIVDLGLIYQVIVNEAGSIQVCMTLTAPACPVAEALVQEVADKAAELPEVATCEVELVWDPPWTQDRMSEDARLELGLL